jgi:exportin-1
VKKGKDNKAVIASCIMYVVGQYPTFLRHNWTFLKTVIKKLFEFMKEEFPGIMEMACNAFLKIAKSTADQFTMIQQMES